MTINTTRFGPIEVRRDDVLQFAEGIVGFEHCREWLLLADSRNAAVAWLQSVDRPALALAVVSPRRFVPGYQVRVARRDLAALKLDDPRKAKVFVILGKRDGELTMNLKAPLVVNLHCRLGRQVIANGDVPVRFSLEDRKVAARKSA